MQMTNGISRNVEFHYNNGSLTANQLARQIIHVIVMLYTININIYAITTDAGGSNHGLVSALKSKNTIKNNAWLQDQDVEFKHPCCNHQIAMYFCGTHNSKNLRNALLGSSALSYNNPKKRLSWIQINIYLGGKRYRINF